MREYNEVYLLKLTGSNNSNTCGLERVFFVIIFDTIIIVYSREREIKGCKVSSHISRDCAAQCKNCVSDAVAQSSWQYRVCRCFSVESKADGFFPPLTSTFWSYISRFKCQFN